nr:hypothetical protein [Tanacetum cinerariifolium]
MEFTFFSQLMKDPFSWELPERLLEKNKKGGVILGPDRPHTYDDLSENDKKRFDADVHATNIVLQGFLKDIYKLINHNIEAKAIWDNMLPDENINEFYVRFHKLVNDIRNIRMTMPNIMLNSKFVNNMSPEWDRIEGSLFRMFRGDRIRIKGTLLGEPVLQEKRVHKTEHGMQIRVKLNRSNMMLLMLAQENGVVLDEEKPLFLTGEQTNTFNADVDEQPAKDLAQNEDNIFQADECDAFDSDVDDEPTAQSIFMAN